MLKRFLLYFCFIILTFIPENISIITQKLQQCFTNGVNLVKEMEQSICENQLYSNTPDDNNPGIILLEHSLLDICGSSIAQGVFYMIPLLVDDILFVR